jgi:hypothetical protein
MTKEVLTIEFRYHDKPEGEHGTVFRSKTITIGIFDTVEEAVHEGNKVLNILAEYFEVRANDTFKLKGLCNLPERLVTNTCYPTKGIQYFAKIDSLKFDDLNKVIDETFKASDRYTEFKNSEQE